MDLILSLIPVSLLTIFIPVYAYSKIKHVPSDKKTIHLNLWENFLKSRQEVYSVYINAKTFEKDNKIIKQLSEVEKTSVYLDKQTLKQEDNFRMLAIITSLCHYHKTKKIEKLILRFMVECGIIPEKQHDEWKILQTLPSNHEKNFSSVVAQSRARNEIIAFAKGNALSLLDQCDRILIDDKKLIIDESLKNRIRKKINNSLNRGEKLIAFAIKPLPAKKMDFYHDDFAEKGMVFIGWIGMFNPPVENLTTILKKAENLKIDFRIFSENDKEKTINQIKKLGLITSNNHEVLNYNDFCQLTFLDRQTLLSSKDKTFFFCKFPDHEIKKLFPPLIKDGQLTDILKIIDLIKKIDLRKKDIIISGLSIQVILITCILVAKILDRQIFSDLSSLFFIQFIIIPLGMCHIFYQQTSEEIKFDLQRKLKVALTLCFTIAILMWADYRNIQTNNYTNFLIIFISFSQLTLIGNFHFKNKPLELTIIGLAIASLLGINGYFDLKNTEAMALGLSLISLYLLHFLFPHSSKPLKTLHGN